MAVALRLKNKVVSLTEGWESKLHSEQGERVAWLTAFALAILYAGLTALLLNRTYDYVDDLTLRDYFRAGLISPFSSHTYSALMNFLYQQVSVDFPWFAVSLWLVKVASLAVCIYLVVAKTCPSHYKPIALLFLLVAYNSFLTRFSWNTTSLLAGSLAMVGLFNSLKGDGRPHVLKTVFLGCLLAFSTAIRRDGVLVASLNTAPPLAALLGLLILLKRATLRKSILHLLVFVAPVLLVTVEDYYFIKWGFNTAERSHDLAQESRAPVYGYGVYPTLMGSLPLLESSHWTRNDIYLIAYAMTQFDENKFAPERFLNVLDEATGPGLNAIKRSAVYNILHFAQLPNFRWDDPNYEIYHLAPFYLLMLVSVLYAVWGGKHFYDHLFAITYLGYVYFTSIYMINYIKLPWYLSHPTYFMFAVVLFTSLEFNYARFSGHWLKRAGVLALFTLALLSTGGFLTEIDRLNREIPVKRAAFFERYQDFATRFGQDAFLFIRPQLYLEYYADPFSWGEQGPKTDYASLGVGSAAWSPIFYRYLITNLTLKYGYQVLPWMVDNPKAYFLSKEKKAVNWLKTFILETYGISVEANPVYIYPDGLTVYQFKGINYFVPHVVKLYDLSSNFGLPGTTLSRPEYVRKTTLNINERPKFFLFQHPTSSITYTLEAPKESFLQFSTAISNEAWDRGGDGVQFDITLGDGTGERQLFSEYVNPAQKLSDRRWRDHKLALNDWAGQTVTLTLTTTPGPLNDDRFDWSGWGNLSIVQTTYFDFTQKFYLARPLPLNLARASVKRIQLASGYQDAIFEHADGWLAFPTSIQPGTHFNFSIGLDPQVCSPEKGDGVQFEVLLKPGAVSLDASGKPLNVERSSSDAGGNPVLLYSKYIDPKNNPADCRWFDESLDLSAYAGEEVEIILVTHAGPQNNEAYDWAYWIAPRLIQTGQ